MSYSAQVTRSFLRRIIIAQSIVITLCALYYLLAVDAKHGIAAFFGGAVALSNSLVLRWNFERAGRIAGNHADKNLRLLYRTAAQRLFLTIGLLALALGGLKLEPQSLLVGFLAGLAALLVARYGFRK